MDSKLLIGINSAKQFHKQAHFINRLISDSSSLSVTEPTNYVRAVLAAKTQCKWKPPDPGRGHAMYCTAQHRPGSHGAQGFTFAKRSDCDTISVYTHMLVGVGQDGAISATKGTISLANQIFQESCLPLCVSLFECYCS